MWFSFAKFLGMEDSCDVEKSDQSLDDTSELPDDSFDEEDEQFEMLLDELGIRSVIGPDDQVGGDWKMIPGLIWRIDFENSF